jgi:hypothetical protein
MSQVINYNGQLINLNGSVIANKFPIRDGLVFYLDGGVDKCYAGTGTTATDLSVSSVSTSLNNGVGFSEDNKGYFSFDGVNDYMRTSGGAVSMGHTQQRTTCAWIRLDDYNSSTKVMVEHTTNFNSNTGAFVLIHSEYGLDGSLQQSIRGPGIYNIAWTDDPYDSNTWYFWCATYDASLGALDCQQHYINGEQVDFTHHGTHRKDLNDYGIDNQDLYFNSRAGTNYFSNHDLGAFYLYDRVLSQDEIRAIYNHQKQRFEHIITDGLVLDLDATNLFSYPGTGTTWSDLSPSGNDATLINGPTFQSDPPAIVFDSTDDRATIFDDNDVFQDDDPWTAIVAYKINDAFVTSDSNGLVGSVRYFPETDPGGWGMIIQRVNSTTTYLRIHLTIDDGVSLVSQQKLFTTNLQHDEWYILAGSYNPDTSSVKAYVNGSLIGTLSVSNGWTVNKTNRLGQIHQATQGGWNGIDYSASFGEVQIYKRTLSDDEIEYNFNARRGRYGI